jgi:hypothetical protein
MNRSALLTAPSLNGSSPDESLLIREYVKFHCSPLDVFSVELPIGAGRTDAPSMGAVIDRMWARITRRRIDLVIWRSCYVVVIEAKMHARLPAVTQLLRNVALFRDEYPAVETVAPMLLCRAADLGVQRRLEDAGASLVMMPVLELPAEAS